jgi:hypothetical protein
MPLGLMDKLLRSVAHFYTFYSFPEYHFLSIVLLSANMLSIVQIVVMLRVDRLNFIMPSAIVASVIMLR